MRSPAFRSVVVIGLVAIALVASLEGRGDAQDLRAAIAAHKRHTDYLMRFPNVVGTAVGHTADGQPAVKVFTKAEGAQGIPDRLEGLPVMVEVTGEIFALKPGPHGDKGGGSSSSATCTTCVLPRPVPIGVSTGNQNECSAGTIGARVTDGSGYYALSNNHVYALENTASLGSKVLQPGLYDTQCVFSSTNVIGQLAKFVRINFNCTCSSFSCSCDPTQDNTVDAAIASTTTAMLGNATPFNGYGMPQAGTGVPASLRLAVEKYGRTTLLTQGQVSGVNVTVIVNYGGGLYAEFKNQIQVSSSRAFIKPGDSGSLLVTADSAHSSVGLLFAGNSSGTMAFANPIGPVLSGLGVSIDGH